MKGLLCLAALLVAAPAWAQSGSVLTFDRGQSYEMSRESPEGRWVARVYVTPVDKSPTADPITVTIRGVTAGTRSAPGLSEMFDSPKRHPDAGPLLAFDVATRTGKDVARGVYDVLLEVSAGTKGEVKTVTLTVPAAALQVQPLLVTRVVPWLFGDGVGGFSPRLFVRETGGKSDATFQVVQADRIADARQAYGGTLAFKAGSVPRHGVAEVTYTVEGDFPLGSTKTSVLVTSAQLESPASGQVEIRTRRGKHVLLVMIGLGLALGFFLRTVIARQVEFGEAKQAVFDEIHTLRLEARDIPDAKFRQKIRAAIGELSRALELARWEKIGDLKPRVTEAETALKKAREELNADVAAAQSLHKEVTRVLETSWRLPRDFTSAIETGRASMTGVRGLLVARNAAAADEQMVATSKALGAFLAASLPRWKPEMDGALLALHGAARLGAAGAADEVRQAVTDTRTKLAAITDAPGETMAQIEPVLRSVHEVRARAAGHVAVLIQQARTTFAEMDQDLRRVTLPAPEKWKQAGDRTERFAGELVAADAADLERSHAAIRDGAAAVESEWGKALLAQASTAEIAELVAAGKFLDAASRVAQALSSRHEERMGGAAKVRETAADAASRARARGDDLTTADATAPGAAVVADVAIPMLPIESDGPTMETRTLRDLFRAKALRWVISAAALTIVGYFIFDENFVGASGELIKVFFWGFTTDIGVDALLSAGKARTAG